MSIIGGLQQNIISNIFFLFPFNISYRLENFYLWNRLSMGERAKGNFVYIHTYACDFIQDKCI